MESQKIPKSDKGLGPEQHTVQVKNTAVGEGFQDPPHGRIGHEGPTHPE